MKSLLCWVFALSWVFTIAQGAETDTQKVLILEDCIAIAIQNHGSIQSANWNVVSADSSLKQARSSFLPRIDFSSDHLRGKSSGGQTGFSFRRTGTITSDQTSITASYSFYDSGRRDMSKNIASAGLRATVADRQRVINELTYNVTSAYFEQLRAARSLSLSQSQQAAAESDRDLIEARIKAGAAAEIDRLPAETTVAQAKLKTLQAESDLRRASSALRNALGLGLGQMLGLTEPEGSPSGINISLSKLVGEALRERAEIVAARERLQAAEASERLAKVGARPQLSVDGAYQRGLLNSPLEQQWSVSANLSYPIFDAGSARSEAKKAEAEYMSASAEENQLEKDVAAEVEAAYLSFQAAYEQLAPAEVAEVEAKANLEAAREKYRLGLGTTLEITTAQTTYFNAQVQTIGTRYDISLAWAALQRAVGAAPTLGMVKAES